MTSPHGRTAMHPARPTRVLSANLICLGYVGGDARGLRDALQAIPPPKRSPRQHLIASREMPQPG